jgi:hypothetical protein
MAGIRTYETKFSAFPRKNLSDFVMLNPHSITVAGAVLDFHQFPDYAYQGHHSYLNVAHYLNDFDIFLK